MSELANFKKKLIAPGTIPPTVEKFRTEGSITLNSTDYKCEGLIFYDCYFKELELNGIDLKNGIIFRQTRFGRLTFRNCTANGYKIGFNDNNANLQFDDCEFSHALEIFGCELERDLQIKNCKKLNNLVLLDNKADSIGIYNSTIQNISAFGGNECISEIRFDSSEIHRFSMNFMGNSCSYFTFIDSIFKSEVCIWAGKTKDIVFNRGVYEDSFTIQAVNCSGVIAIVNADFKKKCEITLEDVNREKTGSCKNIHIASSRFSEGLLFDGKMESKLAFIEELKILSTNGLSGLITVKNFSIQDIILTGLNSSSVIVFDTIKTQNLLVSGYSNYSTTHFLNISSSTKHNSEITIINSHLGKTLFSNFNFKSFEKMIIDNSIFTEITAANVMWFEPTQIFSADSSKKGEHRILRELFRQLKFAMEKQGDYIQALSFKSFEYQAFHKEIKPRSCKEAGQEKITLFFGSINKHGTSWGLPLVAALVSTFLFTSLITLSVRNLFHFELSTVGFINMIRISLLDSWAYYFQLLNPAFQLDKIYQDQVINTPASGFAILHRILLSILIYQIISSFRKYSK